MKKGALPLPYFELDYEFLDFIYHDSREKPCRFQVMYIVALQGCIFELREVTSKMGLDFGQTELQTIYGFIFYLFNFRWGHTYRFLILFDN